MNTISIKIIAILVLIASLTGCAVFGSDMKGLRDIKAAHTKVFDKDLSSCYELTAKALSAWNAVIFQQRKDDYMVAMEFEKIFRSCINTTEVGIFFTQTAPHKTEVKVASLNSSLSQFIAQKLFDYIEKDGKISVQEELTAAAISPRFSFNHR